ncbi:hypothetical protein [Xanthocytophaga agilis]|uniref:Uncharacterized protein n=1 Tax=Xanthocytophaga agilis TaxID=3048010 RepID=A0AAE3R194_9BACT|nr:hypothetical protein [Xanthocytophaga agilis]MDJ1501911.1 hypothetical protein [Xanthocytophaga agilis]
MTILAKSQKVHAEDLHFEHTLWLNELGFYKQELAIFQKRLIEVANRNNLEEFRKSLSHLQNQIIIQNEQSDIHLHDFKLAEKELKKIINANPIAYEHRLFEDHSKERERMKRFVEIYDGFKNEFNTFLIKWM